MTPENKNKLREEMKKCEQFPGCSVLDHGLSVHWYYIDLYTHFVDGDKPDNEWRLPDWLTKEVILRVHQDWVLQWYHEFHDCGKPKCLVIDEEGKRHFPNHAEVSYQVWMEHAEDTERDKLIGELIRKDMLPHTLKTDQIEEFLKDPLAPALIVTALCEIHSNAHQLGRFNTDDFKIKWKRIDRIGKRLFK